VGEVRINGRMPAHLFMSLDKIKDFFSNLSAHDLPTAGAVLVGIVLLFLVFRSGKSFAKVLLFLVAIGLFAGAYWWHTHK
jgi:hypothetical protein